MTDTVLQYKQLRGQMKVLTMADESTYNRQRSYIRFIMPDYQVSCLSGTADGRTENSQLAKYKQSTGKTQTADQRMSGQSAVLLEQLSKTPLFCFLIGILPNTLHSSPKAPNPLCLSAFRGVKSIRALFTYSSPLFTLQFWLICNPPISLSYLFPFLKVKSGEEWVKR